MAGNFRTSLKSLNVKENSSSIVGSNLEGRKPDTFSHLVPFAVSPVTTRAVAHRLKRSVFTAGMFSVRVFLAGPERRMIVRLHLHFIEFHQKSWNRGYDTRSFLST